MSHRTQLSHPGPTPSVPRCGIDPLISPELVARVARSVMSPDEERVLILVDDDLIGHLVLVTDGEVAPYLGVIAVADTCINRVIVAERARSESSVLELTRLLLDAASYGITIEDVVAFDDSSARSQVRAVDRRTVADTRSPERRSRPTSSRLDTSTAPDSTASLRRSSGRS
ncbi:MAG: hypothetical protein RL391_1379 [Actinomycetota bacterium]